MLAAYAHQQLPFDRLVEALRPQRSLAYTPLFQVMLALQNHAEAAVDLPGLRVEMLDPGQTTAQFDLTLNVSEEGDTLDLGWEYSSDLFEHATIVRLCDSFVCLLQAALARPEAPLARLPLFDAEERRRLLEEGNQTVAPYPQECCVHELFEAQAAAAPDAVALRYAGQALRYGELNAAANRLAHHLRTLGVGPDQRVAVCAERGFPLLAGLLAILKAGGAYVPLDPGYPADRLAFQLDDCAPVALLADAAGAAALAGRALAMPVLDLNDAAGWAGQPDTNLPAVDLGLTPQHLAYVIYTSGSTGLPKGVQVPHRGLVNHISWQTRSFGFTAADAILQRTPIAFDASVWELWTPLAIGARLVLLPNADAKDPAAMAALIRAEQVSIVQFVPSLLEVMLPTAGAAVPFRCRYVFCGGEPLSASLAQRARPLVTEAVVNLYGPTEATIDATFWRCDGEAQGRIPIGRPIANTRLYLLDAQGEPVPQGVVGELYIGGAGVARGYLNRPQLTAERFVADRFGGDPQARLYRTGDLGRLRPDGAFEFLGRNDHQVKLRGFRIELGEIEAQLAGHPAVREAVVLAHEAAGGPRLTAWYLPRPEHAAPAADELRQHLAAQLPDYMIPSTLVALDAWPLTPNGKLDRRALPEPDCVAGGRPYMAPVGTVETRVAAVWAELLQRERVGRHDNFFELGGHSLLALQMVARLSREGLAADVRALFGAPTPAGLAASLGSHAAAAAPSRRIPPDTRQITPDMLPLIRLSQAEIDRVVGQVPQQAANVQDIYPLAPLQEGILFQHLLTPTGDDYLMPALVAFDSRNRLDSFLDALQEVIDRHDILRTAVQWDGLPEPVQVVWREAPLPVEELAFDPAAGEVAGQLRARFDPQHYRLDLRRAPLLHAAITFDAGQNRWLLLLLHHHLAVDHTTLSVVLEEIQAYLQGWADQLPPPVPFSHCVAQARLGVSRQDHEDFFRRMLADVDEPTLPFGLADLQGGGVMAQARLELPSSLALHLRREARQLGVSVASLCHLAWAQVLAAACARSDVVFGTVLFGRMHGGEGADRAVGLFVNTLPVRIEVGAAGVATAVRHTHARLTELLRHEHASLALAQRCSAVPAPAPLFSALFNYRHSSTESERGDAGEGRSAGAWEGIDVLSDEERSNFPLSLDIDDVGHGFFITAQVQQQQPAPVMPERICRMLQTALEGLVTALHDAPETPLNSLDVLPAEERRRLLEEGNHTTAPYPQECCVHELFEAQAAAAPDAVALRYAGRALRYGELNAAANRLAHQLRTLGVGPDQRVAVCAERGFPLLTGLLAILKAGGAYVPLDPGYPADRLAFQLDDCAPVALLADAAGAAVLAGRALAMPVLDLHDAAGWAGQPDTNLPAVDLGLTPQHLAYVIYTSGSTGLPKGVQVPHRGLVNHISWQTRSFGFTAADAILQRTPIAFDASVWELWTPLAIGARLVLLPNADAKDPAAMAALIRAEQVSIVQFVPSLLEVMLPTAGAAVPFRCRYVFCGGEPLSASLAQRARPLVTEAVVNLYGPTEATIDATFWRCDGEAQGRIPIGRPIANTRLYLLNAQGEPVPQGVVGELYIGGAGVARGYLNRPELTAERFVADRFGGDPQARLYRTGDLGRLRPDGTFEFLGRNDHQVKLRGFRIELGEIEAQLAGHPAVREAAVRAWGAGSDLRLVAYWLPRPDHATADDEALRRFLAERLPEYMVPAAFVALDAWPLTPNGKLDRRALPAPGSDAYATQPFEPPAGEVEQALAELWSGVLGVAQVGRHDDFFSLGGHSLRVTQLVVRIRQAMEVELPLRQVFTSPTLAAMAERIVDAQLAQFDPADLADVALLMQSARDGVTS